MSREEKIGRALATSYVYGLLARALRDPQADLLDELRSGRWQAALAEAAGQCGMAPDATFFDVLKRLSGSIPPSLGKLREIHTALFAIGGACPPYESEYTAGEGFRKVDIMADVAGFYAAFGLQSSPNHGGLPDSLGAELEFASLAAGRQAAALLDEDEQAAATCETALEKFVLDHLGSWIPSFAEQLERTRDFDFYASLARLVEALVSRRPQSILQ